MNESNQIQGITYLPFHTKNFWDDFYSKKGNETINWYFDITKIDFPDFSVKKLTTNDEILLLGPGTSSLLDYLYSNNFEKICIYDFSPELIKNLKKKYKDTNWEIEEKDVTIIEKGEGELFNVIIDKGCLDCILSDPKNGEKKFIDCLNYILFSLVENGTFYYFSDGKIEDRINLFYKVPGIRYKVETIDMNIISKEEFKDFNQSDNIFFMYIITKS
jgi:phospholipid N-methyltransferase